MVQNVRVAGVIVDFTANSGGYQAGIAQAVTANRQFTASLGLLGPQLARFQQSVTSSLVATAAYAAGVGAVGAAVFGSSRNFLEFERALVSVQKTAGLSDDATQRLGEGLRRLTAEASLLGGPLPVARSELEEIAVVAGQLGITGTRNILAFTEVVGLFGLTTDLAGEQAANAIGKILATTTASIDQIQNLGAAVTALGNAFRGGEADILSQAQFLATQTAAFELPTQDILAFSAVLAAGGQRAETAGTAFQRVIQSLVDAAAEAERGDFGRLGVIAQFLTDEVRTLAEENERTSQSFEVLEAAASNATGGIEQVSERIRAAGENVRSFEDRIRELDAEPLDISALADGADEAVQNFGSVRDRIIELQETIQSGDYVTALRQFLLALRNAGAAQAGSIFTGLLGGQTPPTRVAGIFNFLAKNFDEITRAANLSGEAWQSAVAQLEEAGKFAEARSLRLLVVQNQLRDQSLEVGDALTAAFLPLAENFQVIEVGAATVGAALAANLGRRQIANIRQANAERVKALDLERVQAREARSAAAFTVRNTTAEIQAFQTRSGVITAARGREAAELRAVQIEEGRLTQLTEARAAAQVRANAVSAQVGRVQTALGRTVIEQTVRNLNAEVESAERRVNAARTRLADTQTIIASDRGRGAEAERLERRAARNRLRLLRAEERLSTAVAAQNAHLARNRNLLRRVGTGILNFVGGPIGAIITGLTLATTAFLVFGESQEDILDKTEEIRESIAQQAASARLAAEGITPEGGQIREALDALRQLEQEIGNIRQAREEAALASTAAGGEEFVPEGFDRREEEVRKRIAQLKEDLEILGVEFSDTGATAIEAVEGIRASFVPLNTDLVAVVADVRRFKESFEDAQRLTQRRAELNLELASAGPTERIAREQQFNLETQALRQLTEAERRQRDSITALRATELLYQEALADRARIRDQGGVGTDEFKQADEQVRQLETLRNRTSNLVDAETLRLDLIQEVVRALLQEARASALRIALLTREERLTRALEEPVRISFADPTAQIREVEDQVRAARNRLADLDRQGQQQFRIAVAEPGDAAALQAQFEFQNRNADELRDALQRLRSAETAVSDAVEREAFLRGKLATARDQDREGIIADIKASQQLQVDKATEIENLTLLIAALRRAGAEYDEIAEAIARVARRTREQRLSAQLSAPPRGSVADPIAQVRRVEERLRNLQNSLQDARREVDQQELLVGASPRQAAQLQAAFDVENQRVSFLREAEESLADAKNTVSDARAREVAEIERLASARGKEREEVVARIVAARQAQVDATTEIADLKTLIQAIIAGTADWDRYGAALARVAARAREVRLEQELARPVRISFADPTAQIREVEEQVRAARNRLADLGRRGNQQFRIAIADPREAAALQAAFEVQNRAADELRQAEQRLADARTARQDAGARELALRLELATARDQDREAIIADIKASQQLQVDKATEIEDLVLLVAALRRAGAEYEEIAEAIARVAQRTREQRLSAQLVQAPRISVPDEQAQVRAAEEGIRAARNRLEDTRRQALQEAQIRTVDARTAEGLRARFEVENEYLNRIRDAQQRRAVAENAVNDARAREEALIERLAGARGKEREEITALILQQRQRRADAETEVENAEALIAALQRLGVSYEEAAAAAQQLAEQTFRSPLQALIEDTEDLGDALEGVAVSALGNFEDALVGAFKSGRVELDDLLDALGEDLVRTLIQQTITPGLAGLLGGALGTPGGSAVGAEIATAVTPLIGALHTAGAAVGQVAAPLAAIGVEVGTAITTSAQAASTALSTAIISSSEALVAVNAAATAESTATAAAIQAAGGASSAAIQVAGQTASGAIAASGQAVSVAIQTAGQAAAAAIGAANAGAGAFSLFHGGGIAGYPRQLRSLRQGLGPREMLAVLLKDEEILTRSDPRHRWNAGKFSGQQISSFMRSLPRFHEGGIAGAGRGGAMMSGEGGLPQSIRWELINESGQQLELVDNGTRIDMDEIVMSAILRNARRNGQMMQALRRSVLGQRV